MKKYIYSGILLGTIIALVGYNANSVIEDKAKESKTEIITNEVMIKNQTLPSDSKLPKVLNQEQKKEHYKEYTKIVKQINALDGTNHLELSPIEEFADEDWVEPAKFRETAYDRAHWEFTSSAYGGDLE